MFGRPKEHSKQRLLHDHVTHMCASARFVFSMMIDMGDCEFSASQMAQLRMIFTCTTGGVHNKSISAHVTVDTHNRFSEILERFDQIDAMQASINRMLKARQDRKKYGDDSDIYT